MKKLLIFTLLFCSSAAFAAIATSGSLVSCIQNTGTITTCTASVTFSASDSAVLVESFNGNGFSISSVSDAGCGGTWVHGPTISNSTIVTIDSYYLTGATGGTCNLTVTHSTGTTKTVWLMQAYSGVGSIGNTCTRAPSSNATQSISCNIQTANNWIVAGFADATVSTFTASVGNLRGQASTTTTNQDSEGLNDNTSGSVGSVTNTVTYGVSATYAAVALELVASGGAGAGRLFNNGDYNRSVLLQGSSNANYILPASGGSSSVYNYWCGFPLSTGANAYTILPQAPATLNNQSSGIVLPQWQMTRVCFDGTNYWMQPPAVGGKGVVITPSATAFIYDLFSAGHTVSSASQTAAITTSTLCAATSGNCNVAGAQYHIHWNMWGSGTACSSVTAGSVTFLLTWTDENTVTHTAVALPMQVQTGAATTTVQSSFPFQTSLANESASGDFTISTNGTIIQYATGYTACTTGTGTYNLRAAVQRIQ